ncbi:hypothetical protein CDL12_09309 [Handroanthus impetiginosus]|uniref:Uncharacterized protein n=1 Tax=Handroanthus impetiginosus TaxID=429701 RepID=A0A2G9HKI9_9LAMI|nr:hypothetical protein CDL12_09309 [Handroanthus impetiginosus]
MASGVDPQTNIYRERERERESEMDGLTEEEKKALRGSKFAPLPSRPNQTRPQSRQAHPGGPMKTNKAAALAKFLERKLQEPNGLSSVDPRLVELAVKNAKQTVKCSESGTSTSGRIIHHVDSFGDVEESDGEEKTQSSVPKKRKQKKKKKKKEKNQKDKQKKHDDSIASTSKIPKKKLKL